MILSWIWCVLLGTSIIAALWTGRGPELTAAALDGAQKGITLAISIAGSICLWSGVGKVMEKAGISGVLSRFLRPVLSLLFPGTKRDPALSADLSANICANFLGLGNAATPMGIRAARRMTDRSHPGVATDQLCRLIVLNTASIQLLPTNIAALRLSAGCQTPFDILPAVWLTSIFSVTAGLLSAWGMGKLWKHD